MKPPYSFRSLLFVMLALFLARPGFAGDDKDKGRPAHRGEDIEELVSFVSLQEIFNHDKGYVRMVALLSPSCGYCIKGYRYMRKILDEVQDERLRMYVVWEPMLSADTKKLAAKMSRRAKDPRMVYQAWDEGRITGQKWTSIMHESDARWQASGPAWDVYFLYDAGAVWSPDAPTPPPYWQHQGAGPRDLVLNYKVLKEKVEAALARAE